MGTCEWDDAASWLLSTSGGGGGGVQQRTPPPRDTLTDDQRERIRLRREEALARRRRTGGAEAPAPSTAPGAGFACAATTETASPLAARVPRAPSPPSPVRSLHDDAFDPPPHAAPPPPAAAAPENLERKRAFAAALAAAMAQTPGDGDGDDSIPAGGATRPDWLVSLTDAAGAPRPVHAYKPTLATAGLDTFDPASLRVTPDQLTKLPKFTAQFWRLKASLMDCVIVCRHGSFYNMFDVDSDVGVGIGLRISGKPARFMQKVGCHKDHFDAWAAKLLGQGYAVARVEETSRREGGAHVKDKDGGKGCKGTNTKGGSGSIIEREVSEIYTPALDRGLTREEGARYLLALAELPIEDGGGGAEGGAVEIGVALVDADVGEIVVGGFRDSPARDALATLLAVFEPREIVTSRTRVGEGSLTAPTLAALRRRSADLPEGCAFRFVERGGAAAPSFNAEDTLAALAHFDAVVYPWAVHEDGNVECYQPDLLPEALRDASDAAFEALAYATRHLAWSGAAVTTLCQCRFRKLLVGLDDAPAAKVNATTGPDMYDRKSVAGRRAVPTRREYWDNIWGEGEADMRTPSPSPGSITTDFGRAHPQYAPPDRRRRESRRVGEAHGPSVVRLDASAITSLHLLRGDDDAKDGSIGSLFNYLDATVTAPGRRRLREWILQPLGDAASIEERLDAAEELIDVFGADCAGIRESLVSAASGGTDAVRGISRSIALAADACDAANEAMLRDAPPPIYPQSGDGFACPGAISGLDNITDRGWRYGNWGRERAEFHSVRSELDVETNDLYYQQTLLSEREELEGEEMELLGEAAVAFFAMRRKEVRGFVDSLDAIAGCAAALASLGDADCGLLADFRELGEKTQPGASALRARLVHTHEYASRVYGDPASADEDDDADAEGKPKKPRRVKKSKGKSKKSKGKSADSFGWIFDEGGGALGDLAALPSPGTCPAFDDALHDALRHDERGNEAEAADAAKEACRFAARNTSASLADFAENRNAWREVVSAAADLDVLQAFAVRTGPKGDRASGSPGSFSRPVFLDDARDGAGANRLALTGSWHPLVPAPAFVRNDVVLGADAAPGCVLLTGPNMGGKSTLLRQVALAVITAHIGCRVPASTCELNVVDSVYCRVGAGDGIQSGVSTFLAEMSDVAAMLNGASRKSLLIIDELGRGTSTADGYAIAFAVAGAIADRGARCLFATHYHALAQDLAKSPSNATRISVWHMGAVVGEGDAVRFTYELTPGPAPLGSCAMNVARIAGFPADLLKRAKDVADKSALSGALASAPEGVNDGVDEPACEEPLSEEEAALVRRLTSDPVVCGEAEADEAWLESLIETQKLCLRL